MSNLIKVSTYLDYQNLGEDIKHIDGNVKSKIGRGDRLSTISPVELATNALVSQGSRVNAVNLIDLKTSPAIISKRSRIDTISAKSPTMEMALRSESSGRGAIPWPWKAIGWFAEDVEVLGLGSWKYTEEFKPPEGWSIIKVKMHSGSHRYQTFSQRILLMDIDNSLSISVNKSNSVETVSVFVFKMPEGHVWETHSGGFPSSATPENYIQGLSGGAPNFTGFTGKLKFRTAGYSSADRYRSKVKRSIYAGGVVLGTSYRYEHLPRYLSSISVLAPLDDVDTTGYTLLSKVDGTVIKPFDANELISSSSDIKKGIKIINPADNSLLAYIPSSTLLAANIHSLSQGLRVAGSRSMVWWDEDSGQDLTGSDYSFLALNGAQIELHAYSSIGSGVYITGGDLYIAMSSAEVYIA